MFRINSNIDYLVVGLGNIGKEYEHTRHNIGFMVLKLMAEKFSFDFNKQKFKSFYNNVDILGKKVLFLKPSTFMNNSGEAVLDVVNFYKINMEKVIVIYDDVYLDLGNIRIKRKGSDGGHNGIKSIIALTHTDVFTRIKVGISPKPYGYNLADWVLSKFNEGEQNILNKSVSLACDSLECILKNGLDVAMNIYNKKNL